MDKTITFLPKCHHYVVVGPEKHNIPDDRENVTLIPFKYPRDVLSNRSHFDGGHLEIYLIFVLWILISYFVINQKNYTIY